MEKTKLGISIGLLSAGLYFMGLMGIVPLLILAGYVLVCESNEWVKKCAVKAIVIYILFTVLSVLLGMCDDVISIFNTTFGWLPFNFHLSFSEDIMDMLHIIVSAVQSIVFIVLGITSLSKHNIKMGPLDDMVDKHM